MTITLTKSIVINNEVAESGSEQTLSESLEADLVEQCRATWVTRPCQSGPTPTLCAFIHLPAGVAAAGGAPLKMAAGVNLTTPVNGALEYDGTNLYFTIGGVRKIVTLATE